VAIGPMFMPNFIKNLVFEVQWLCWFFMEWHQCHIWPNIPEESILLPHFCKITSILNSHAYHHSVKTATFV
jgi:hypothetical protein